MGSFSGSVTVVVEALNVPLNWTMTVRGVPLTAPDLLANATVQSGDATMSTWSATFPTLPNGNIAFQVRAAAP